MADAELTLKWEKFGLSNGLSLMLENGELVDVTIVCQGEFLQAHKTILAACSQQFRQMFAMNPCKHPVVFMQDAQLANLKSLLTFMYTGQTTVLQSELAGFMTTAEALRVSGLTTNTRDSTYKEQGCVTSSRSRPSKRPRMSHAGPSKEQLIMDDVKFDSEELRELSPEPDDDDLDQDDYDQDIVPAELGDNSNNTEPLPGTSIVSELQAQEAWMDSEQAGPSTSSPTPGPSTENNKTAPGVSSRDNLELGEMFEDVTLPPPPQNEDDESLKCNHCGRQSKSKNALKTHIRCFHTGTDAGVPHICDICGKSYSLKSGLQVHMKNIHGDNAVPVTCQDCGKDFANSMAHYKHVFSKHRFRISQKDAIANVSDQRKIKQLFELPDLPDIKLELPMHNYLSMSLSTKEDERNFACQICNNRFKSRPSLRNHINNYHSSQANKPHVCDICGKKYAVSSGLRVHKKNEHGEHAIPVTCEDCGQTFKNKMAHYKHVFARHRHRISEKKSSNL